MLKVGDEEPDQISRERGRDNRILCSCWAMQTKDMMRAKVQAELRRLTIARLKFSQGESLCQITSFKL